MRMLKGWISPLVLTLVLASSVTTVNAGILVTGLSEERNCVDPRTDWGILVTGFTGIIVTGFTGIIVTGVTETPKQPCKS
jgi:hypothetical protein